MTILCLLGGEGESYEARDEVLAWSDEYEEWMEIGKMRHARSFHAVTSITMDDPALLFCI